MQYDLNGTAEEKSKLFSVPDFIGFACKRMGKYCVEVINTMLMHLHDWYCYWVTIAKHITSRFTISFNKGLPSITEDFIVFMWFLIKVFGLLHVTFFCLSSPRFLTEGWMDLL